MSAPSHGASNLNIGLDGPAGSCTIAVHPLAKRPSDVIACAILGHAGKLNAATVRTLPKRNNLELRGRRSDSRCLRLCSCGHAYVWLAGVPPGQVRTCPPPMDCGP